MQPLPKADRDAMFASFTDEAIHLEMRDVYATNVEASRYAAWLRGEAPDPADEAEWWRPWREMMAEHRAAGRTLRRLRIVSEPVTSYIRFEWLDAAELVACGEDVRWLSRQHASDLMLPGNDFWLFDGERLSFTNFSGDGFPLEHTLTTDQDLIAAVKTSFEAAWARAVPHAEFRPA